MRNSNNEYFKKYQEDVNTVWSKKLVGEFNIQNNLVEHALNVYLNYPNFTYSFEKGYWGRWNSDTRTIDISYNLLHNYEWDAVVQTLKHEMAHMIVSEIWGCIDDNRQDHGELFKKACNIMKVDPSKSSSAIEKASFRLTERESVLSKIYKLFWLGESDHKAEAEAAISKAHELMAKYNISTADLPKNNKIFVFRPIGNIYEKVPTYIKQLAHTISEHYFVKYIFITHSYGHRNHKRFVEIYGEPHNVEIADYIYHFLLWEGERQWKEFQKSEAYQKRFSHDDYFNDDTNDDYTERCRRKAKYSKTAFLEGVYSGFANTLDDRQQEVIANIEKENANTLPVCTDDPLLEEKYNSHYRPRNWNSGVGGSNGGGYSEGREVGKGIVIRQGVTSGIRSGRALIGA